MYFMESTIHVKLVSSRTSLGFLVLFVRTLEALAHLKHDQWLVTWPMLPGSRVAAELRYRWLPPLPLCGYPVQLSHLNALFVP